jgi:hypothetical protein
VASVAIQAVGNAAIGVVAADATVGAIVPIDPTAASAQTAASSEVNNGLIVPSEANAGIGASGLNAANATGRANSAHRVRNAAANRVPRPRPRVTAIPVPRALSEASDRRGRLSKSRPPRHQAPLQQRPLLRQPWQQALLRLQAPPARPMPKALLRIPASESRHSPARPKPI